MSATTRRYLSLLHRASQYEILARHYPIDSTLCARCLRAACECRRRAARIFPLTVN